jgi:hypothetical protein
MIADRQREWTLPVAVVDWRELRFLQMGCEPASASQLALLDSSQVDLHDFEALIDSGCSPALAEEILLGRRGSRLTVSKRTRRRLVNAEAAS